MAFRLTDDLLTGNATIDSEHRQLIEAINNLMAACSSGKGRAELAHTTNFLMDYTAKHFADEERLQLQSQYPDYTRHKQYHDTFKIVVGDLARELQTEGATIALVSKVNNSVGGWLINHIRKEDVKVAAHIRSASK